MKNILIILSAAILIFSCGKKEGSTQNEQKKDTLTSRQKDQQTNQQQNNQQQNNPQQQNNEQKKPADTTGVSYSNGSLNIKWGVEFAGTGEYESPINNVYIYVNSKKNFVLKETFNFYPTPKTDYKTNNIPKDALIALRGWWAGAGIDLWAVQKDNEIIVMKKEIGETSNEDGEASDYEGKPEKVISVKIE